MSFYDSREEDFHQKLSEAKKHFYKNKSYISNEERFFCCEYARFKMGKACFQFVSLIKDIGEIELAQKVTKVTESKLRIKNYSSEKELFGDILDMRLDLQMMENGLK